MFDLIINRKKWCRGCSPHVSQLLVSQNKTMCCLGFLGRACGLKAKEILDHTSPVDVLDSQEHFSDNILQTPFSALADNAGNTDICRELMQVNDDVSISDKKRESQLKKLFRKIKVKVTFEN